MTYQYKGQIYLSDSSIPQMYLHQCVDCGRRFPTREKMLRHKRTQHGEILSCDFCPYKVPKTRAYMMLKHQRVHRKIKYPKNLQSKVVKGMKVPVASTQVPATQLTEKPPSNLENTVSGLVNDLDLLQDLEVPAEEWNAEPFRLEDILAANNLSLQEICQDDHSLMKKSIPKISSQKPKEDATGEFDITTSGCLTNSVIPGRQTELGESIPRVPLTTTTGSQTESTDIFEFVADPRFALAGAPSLLMEGKTAEFLRSTHITAREHLGNYRRHVFLFGYLRMKKTETVTLPDGRTYTLTETWTRDQGVLQTKENGQQTNMALRPINS